MAIDISVCPKLYGDDGVFSCSGNSRDITLDTTNYDYDFSDFSKVYGLHKAWYDYELPVAVDNNGKPLTDDNGVEIHKRNRNTTGYAGIQGIDASNEASSVTGGQLDGLYLQRSRMARRLHTITIQEQEWGRSSSHSTFLTRSRSQYGIQLMEML